MTSSQRIVASLLACSVAVPGVGCTSMRTIPPETRATAPVFGPVRAGDTVSLQMRDGKRARFVVQQVDGNGIISPAGTRYEREDIARLQRQSFSGWKTAALIGGVVFATMIFLISRFVPVVY